MDTGTVKKIRLLTEIEDKIKLGLSDPAQPWLFYQAQTGVDTLNEMINKVVAKKASTTPVIVTPSPRGGPPPIPPSRGNAPMTRGTPPRGPRGPALKTVSGGAAKTSTAELTAPNTDELKSVLLDITELKKTLADTFQIAESKRLIKKIKTNLDNALPTKDKIASPMFDVQITAYSSRLGIEQAFDELSNKTDDLLEKGAFGEVANEFQSFLDGSTTPSRKKDLEKFPNFNYQRSLIFNTLTNMQAQNSFLKNYIDDPIFRKNMDIEHGSPVISDKTFIEVLTGNGKIKGLDQLAQDRQAIVEDRNKKLAELAFKHKNEIETLEATKEKELKNERAHLTDKDLEKKEAEILENYIKLSESLIKKHGQEKEDLSKIHDEIIKNDPLYTTFKAELESLKNDLVTKVATVAREKPTLVNLRFSMDAEGAINAKMIESDALAFLEDTKELISNTPFLNFMKIAKTRIKDLNKNLNKNLNDANYVDHPDIEILEKLFNAQSSAYQQDAKKVDDSFKKTLEDTLKLLNPEHLKLLVADINTTLISREKTLNEKHPDKIVLKELVEKQTQAYKAGNIDDFFDTTLEESLKLIAPENRVFVEDDLRNGLEMRTIAFNLIADFKRQLKEQTANIELAQKEIISKGKINISSIFEHKEGFDAAKQALNRKISNLTIINRQAKNKENTSASSAINSLKSVKTLQQAIIIPKQIVKDNFFELLGKTSQSHKARINFTLLFRQEDQVPTQTTMLKNLTELAAKRSGPAIPLPNIIIVALASGYISLNPGEKFNMLKRDISDKTCKINEGKLKDFEQMVSDLYLQLEATLPQPMSIVSNELKQLLAIQNRNHEVDLLEIASKKTIISPTKYQEELKAKAKAEAEAKAAEKPKAETVETPKKSLAAEGATPSKAKANIKITYTPEQQKEIDSLQESINKNKTDLSLVKSELYRLNDLQKYDIQKFEQTFGQNKLIMLQKQENSLISSIEKADAKSKEIVIEAKKLCALNATTSALEELKKKLEAGQTVTKEEELDVIAKTQESFTALQDSEKMQKEKAAAAETQKERIVELTKIIPDDIFNKYQKDIPKMLSEVDALTNSADEFKEVCKAIKIKVGDKAGAMYGGAVMKKFDVEAQKYLSEHPKLNTTTKLTK